MIPKKFLACLLLLIAVPVSAQKQDGPAPQVSAGTIVDLGVVQSRNTDPRRVVVWLPSGYSTNGPKYSVLYMHDGQNLFDTKTAGFGMEWQIDETLDRLIQEGNVRPTIVVGIWSTPKRLQEYVPSKAFNGLSADDQQKVHATYGGDPLSDGYLKFLVIELKPMIDGRFNVKTDKANTAIMGSSMGALISLYAIDEFPQVFGAAGMVSTHWPRISSVIERYLSAALPSPASHKLYFDHGSETLDADYARYQDRVDAVVARRGYRQWGNTLSLSYPGQAHNEISWASRVAVPLQFLLPPIKQR